MRQAVGDVEVDGDAGMPGVVKGKTVSSYPAVGPEVTLGGGTAADIPVDQAVTDGTLVSAPAWPAHPAWIAQFLDVLGTRIVHE